MSSFPEELWIEILHYLSLDSLCRLYVLNRTFFQAYLSRKYEKITIGEILYRFRGGKAPRYLEHISEPYISSRINHLGMVVDHEIQSAPVCIELLKTISKANPSHSLGHLLRSTSAGGFFYPHPARKISLPLVQFLRRLRNISTITLHIRHNDRKHNAILMGFTWMRFADNLSHLNLLGSLDGILCIVESSPVMESLTSLSIDIDKISRSALEREKSSSELARFILRCPSVQSLTMRSAVYEFTTLLGAIVSSIHRLPQLVHLSVFTTALEFINGNIHPIVPFFSRHAPQLVSLYSPLLPDGSWVFDDANCLDGLHLQSLTLCDSWPRASFSSRSEIISRLLGSSYHTLVTLDIRITFGSLDEALAIFSSSLPPYLQYLRFRIFSLSPRLFDFLSENVKNLRSLLIETLCILPDLLPADVYIDPQTPVSLIQHFYDEMIGREYSQWYLQLLDLVLQRKIRETPPSWNEVMRKCIPSLETCTIYVTEPESS